MRPGIRVAALISHWVRHLEGTGMRLGSGWDHLYHTGLTPGVLEWKWDQGGIIYITLGWHLEYWNETGIRVGSLISHWVDTWSTGMSLGSGCNQLYHIGLTPGVLEWEWDQGGITYVTLGWHLEYWNETGIKVGSFISHWVDTGSTGIRLWSGCDHLYHIGLTPGVRRPTLRYKDTCKRNMRDAKINFNFRSDKNWRSSVLKLFAPIGYTMLTKTKKKIVEIWKLKNLKKKFSGDIVELPTKFGLDPWCGFWEIWIDRRRTDDGRLGHNSSSADKVKHS